MVFEFFGSAALQADGEDDHDHDVVEIEGVVAVVVVVDDESVLLPAEVAPAAAPAAATAAASDFFCERARASLLLEYRPMLYSTCERIEATPWSKIWDMTMSNSLCS